MPRDNSSKRMWSKRENLHQLTEYTIKQKEMKITLEFDGVEERDDARTALDGYKWKLAMWDLDQLLRSTTKYDVSLLKHNEEACEAEYEIAEKIREEIGRILGDYNLNLD